MKVEHVEVDHSKVGLRLFLFIFFVVVAVVAISVGVVLLTRTESGWQEISPRASAKTNCSDEFTFYYYFEGKSSENNAKSRSVQNLYTELTVTAYQLFTPYEEIADVNNLYYINRHVNEEIEVDPWLYRAFETVSSSRFLFGAPIRRYYESLCTAEGDWAAEGYDPAKNDEIRAFYQQILTYANDPNSIRVKLLGNNRLRLTVSDAYVAFAQENEIDVFIDFSYWKNAFIIDEMASRFREAGLSNGLLSSYDGYTRTLFDQDCTFGVYSKIDSAIYLAGSVRISGYYSAIDLHSFITVGVDGDLHYLYDDGTYVHAYVDMNDAVGKCSTDCLLVYAHNKSCADLLLGVYDIWTADTLNKTALSDLDADYVYTEGTDVHYSDESLNLTLYNGSSATFTAVLDAE